MPFVFYAIWGNPMSLNGNIICDVLGIETPSELSEPIRMTPFFEVRVLSYNRATCTVHLHELLAGDDFTAHEVALFEVCYN